MDMLVKSVSQTELIARTPIQRRGASAPQTERDTAVFHGGGKMESLARAMDSVPEVRANAIERGRELFSSVLYPPTAIIRGISRLVARNLDKTE